MHVLPKCTNIAIITNDISIFKSFRNEPIGNINI